MGALTNYAEAAILNTMRATAFEDFTPYLALFTATPGETGGGTEVSNSGTAYVRQAVTFGAPDAANGVKNSAEIVFPVATASWGTVTHVAIFDADEDGNMFWYGALTNSKAIGTDDQMRFAIDAFQVTVD